MPKKRIVAVAEFSIHPIGSGTSLSPYVRPAVASISKIRGLKYQVTPMATVLESPDLDKILKAVKVSHRALRGMGCQRISSILRVDERLDKPRKVSDKVKTVQAPRRLR